MLLDCHIRLNSRLESRWPGTRFEGRTCHVQLWSRSAHGRKPVNAAQAETAAQMAAAAAEIEVRGFQRRKPARRPLPEHLPHERVVYPGPAACPCCGGALHKIGEDVTEMLELVPRQWKVIQHVREKFSCRTWPWPDAARTRAVLNLDAGRLGWRLRPQP